MRILKNIFSRNSRPLEGGNFFVAVEKIIGFKTNNIKYYKKAFTHRSSNKTDEKGNPLNYERLECVLKL
jgi:ribonuclease-3